MTIPLKILGELQDAQSVTFAKMLNQEIVDKYNEEKVLVDEKRFRWELNSNKYIVINLKDDAMGNEKLAEGIKKFAIDIDTLEKIVNDRLL
jgi:transaldolase